MTLESFFLSWGALGLVLVVEHFLLERVYRRPSSLRRLLVRPSDSAKTDFVYLGLYYGVIGWIRRFVVLLTPPGIALVGLEWLTINYGHHGLLAGVMPRSGFLTGLVWLAALDLARYAAHVLIHKVPLFWRYHRLHHAGTDFNVILGNRVSLAELFFNDAVVCATLLLLLGWPGPTISFGVWFARALIDLLQHSDLPWDYGALGWVFVSPRFHRLHHSTDPLDYDRNYGDVLSIWDYLFGTVGARYRVSTETADRCKIGLSPGEDAQLNGSWWAAAFNETFVDWGIRAGARLLRRARGAAVGASALGMPMPPDAPGPEERVARARP